MHARARILGHSVHQMLIVFPLGLLGTAAIFDIIYLATENGSIASAAYWMILAGLIMGVLAAVFGVIDFSAIPRGTRANRIGLMHAGVNIIVLLAFGASFALRADQQASPPMPAMVLSIAGVALAVLGGWLGGELVTRLGVGVDEGANLNAPNSIRHAPGVRTSGEPSEPVLAAPIRRTTPEPGTHIRAPDDLGPTGTGF